MLVPKMIRGQMQFIDGTPMETQRTLREGCNCGCGWSGDPFLSLRMVPAKYGRGFAILHKENNSPGIILYRSDREQPLDVDSIDHRCITYMQDARKNWENRKNIARILDEHDAKVDLDNRKKEAEIVVGMSQMVGKQLRKEGNVRKTKKNGKH